MKFIHPQLFWLAVPAVTAVIVLGTAATRRRREALRRLLGSRAESPEMLRLSMAKRRWRRFFLAAAMCFLIAAAARPYWSTRRLPGKERGRDVLVIFDVSKSMLATDLAPSRLDHAKFLLRELVKENRGDRFALVAFAGEAFLACPFTSDAAAFDQYVDELSPDLVPVGGTNLEKALRTALAAFRSAGGHRAVVIFTDGDELTGDSGRMIATLREQKIPIMVIGLGDPATATPLPGENGELRRDRDGKVITSRLNEPALKRLAAENDGVYLRASVADTGLAAVTARLQALERAESGSGPKTVPVEKFPIALIGAAVALLCALLISETPFRRRTALWGGIAAALLLLTGAAPAEELPAAPEKKTAAAPAELPPAAETPPADPVECYNRALSLQRKGETAKAVPLYEGVLRDGRAGSGAQSRALFNLGVANHLPARAAFRAAEEEVRRQQLDPALRKLADAEAALKKAEELYTQSLTAPEASAFESSITADLEALTLDRRAIETLKKKIEELKKQQQKAREQAKQAQQQNQQKQDQQQSQQKQQKQDQQQQQQNQKKQQQQQQQQNQQKQDRQQQSQGQQKQDQQQQQQKQQQSQQNQQQDQQKQSQGQQDQQKQDPQSQDRNSGRTDAARDAARELERQARDLGQRKLADDAAAAQRELEKAAAEQRGGDRDKAQRHLDEAVKRLGEPRDGDGKKQEKPQAGEGEKQGEKPEKTQEKPQPGKDENKPLPAQPQPAESGGEKAQEKRENAAEMVRILDDESKELRDKLNRLRRSRRPAVEKDW